MKPTYSVTVRAVRATQAGTEIYLFVLPASRILEIAEISRIGRNATGELEGFQRPEIRSHVKGIAEYLDQGDVLFPNPILLALAPGVKFGNCRGSKPKDYEKIAVAGTLRIPKGRNGKVAWIVDGQQRSLALAESGNQDRPVPVVAFVSDDVAVHREQFILVNKAKPLPARLIDVLLPSVSARLPRDLSARRLPSALCDALNDEPTSPFFRLIKRPGDKAGGGVVQDSALTRALKRSIDNPLGALAAHVRPDGTADVEAMFGILCAFWRAVREIFPEAWGLPPEQSRLMHSAGIEILSSLMDHMLGRCPAVDEAHSISVLGLSRIAPHCRWTEGRWEMVGMNWDDLEATSKSITKIRRYLLQIETAAGRLAA